MHHDRNDHSLRPCFTLKIGIATCIENRYPKEAIVEVDAHNTPIKRVYLKRLIRQDATGIWTVVGYDPAP
ncbi:hypothetical protein CWI35_03175 [[Bacillus] caldolyticus]|uniref:Uncharacterized protein n=1 Tax=Bacillus caldolyticus TaxID=1394 RepID=A0ABN5FYK6_BACCL|nr:hypothetical protein CWI35_03175 [[Bacillus] caldolyticus]